MSKALREIGNQAVTLKINSPGGDVFAGVTMYNQLRAHKSGVTVQVLGIAASAASIIAMAGRRVEMARNAKMMIHKAWALAVGNEDVMVKSASVLRRVDESLADTYAARAGMTNAKVMAMMAAETWMTVKEAIELGFADAELDQDAQAGPRSSGKGPPGRQQLIDDLRRLGLSKAAAKAVAAGGWPAVTSDVDTTALAAQIRTSLKELKFERNSHVED